MLVTDIEILRLHYAETLKAWRERFLAHRDEVERLYDARFVRMWEFYLAAAEMAFREQAMMVFQLQLTKRQGVVPMTRDYIARESARLRASKAASGRRCGSPASDCFSAARLPIRCVKPSRTPQFHSSVIAGTCSKPASLCPAAAR